MAFEALVLTLGISHANPQDCGIWYVCNAQSPYVLHQNSFTYGLGWKTDKYRFGMQSLGGTETDSFVVDGTFKESFRTIGKEWGVSLLRQWQLGQRGSLEAGIWVYRSEVFSTIGTQYFSSAAYGIGPQIGWQYGLVALTIRGAESRAKDWNGNHQPSPIKGFVSTFEVRF